MALSFIAPQRKTVERIADVLVSARLKSIKFGPEALKAAGINPAEADKFAVVVAVDQDEVGNIQQTGQVGFAAVPLKTKGGYKLSERGDFTAPQVISCIYDCMPNVGQTAIKTLVRDAEGKVVLKNNEPQYEETLADNNLWFNIGEVFEGENGTKLVTLVLAEQEAPSDERYMRRSEVSTGKSKSKKSKNSDPIDDNNAFDPYAESNA